MLLYQKDCCMRTKMRLLKSGIFWGTLVTGFFVGAGHKVNVITPPAQLRLPEHLLMASSPTLARSNQTEEFVSLDADTSLILDPVASDNSASILVDEGIVLPLQDTIVDSAESSSSRVEDNGIEAVLEDQNKPLQEMISVIDQNVSTQDSDAADAFLESQWVLNPVQQDELLSIDSKEAKSLLEFVRKTCADSSSTVRMSLNGRDVLAFLTMTRRYKFDALVVDTGLRCFYNKFKSCMVIDDAVLHQILPELVAVLEGHLDYEKNSSMAISSVQRDVEQLMCESFIKYSHMLTTRPNDFLTKLSRMVARSAYMSLESDETVLARSRHDRERLRVLTIQFINLLLDRVVWPPHAFESIWPSFVRIGSYVCDFAQKNVITHMDDFKDLYATFTQRFVFYINLHAAMLPSDFFRVIQNDLSMGAVFFLEYDEHAELKKTFERELNGALIKSLAYEQSGLMS